MQDYSHYLALTKQDPQAGLDELIAHCIDHIVDEGDESAIKLAEWFAASSIEE